MDDIEKTLGHDLQIGCERCRRTIDVDVDHHSTPSAFHTRELRIPSMPSGTDATSASSSTTKLVAPPVLMISREVNARPAMVSSGSANPVPP